ncbi:MAG: hypothetical protein L0216_13195 [Planctomycetales bacterium]|nr:hypothetical protein [Planctomycetales bacterium]
MRRSLGLASALLVGASALAQDSPKPAEDPAAAARAEAVAQEGVRAFEAKEFAKAIERFAAALPLVEAAFPAEGGRRVGRLLKIHRSIAWCRVRLGDREGFLRAASEAYKLLAELGGHAPEEAELENALWTARDAVAKDLEAVRRLLGGYHDILVAAVPPPGDKRGEGDEFVHRTRVRVGQVLHDTAYTLAQADSDETERAYRRAFDWRRTIPDWAGAAWSSQNLFRWLADKGRDADAAASFGVTARILRETPNAEIEASLAANGSHFLAAWTGAGEWTRAVAFLDGVLRDGALRGSLPTFTDGFVLSTRLSLGARLPKAPPIETVRALVEGLRVAAVDERQPRWDHEASLGLSRAAAESGSGEESLAAARSALAAAERLGDPRRAGRARIALARAVAASGKAEEAERTLREGIWVPAGRVDAEGGDPVLREEARRAGEAIAKSARRADWEKRYELTTVTALEGLPGTTWLGADIAAFLESVRGARGDGAVLTVTRRGNRWDVRSAFATGVLRFEMDRRLRYVNANGILLAFKGPDVAVIGTRPEATAPAAKGWTFVKRADLDPERMEGESLPPFASQATVLDGETAFVNRFLRISR